MKLRVTVVGAIVLPIALSLVTPVVAIETGQPAATSTPAPSPSASPSPPVVSRPIHEISPEEQHALEARARLRGAVVAANVSQTALAASIAANTARQDRLMRDQAAAAARIQVLDVEILRLQDEISTTQGRIERERQQLAELSRAAYTRPRSLLVAIAASHGLADALTNAEDLLIAARRANELGVRLRSDLAKLDDAEQKVALDRERQQALMNEAMARASSLQALVGIQQTSQSELADWLVTASAELATPPGSEGPITATTIADQLVAREHTRINALAVAEREYEKDAALKASPIGIRPVLASNRPLRLSWPAPQFIVTQPFGPTDLWLEPAYRGSPHFHLGTDLVIPDRRVEAAAPGTVLVTSHGSTGYGNFVMIDHGHGVVTLYGHLESIAVHEGDPVAAGEQLGVEGSTGASTGLHLHFEIRVDGRPVDPAVYVAAHGVTE